MMIGAILGTLMIVLVTIGIGRAIDRKAQLVPSPEALARPPRQLAPSYRPGEAPATAIRATGTALDTLRATRQCPDCRTRMSAEPDDRVRYGGRVLLVMRARCAACGTTRSIYVDAA